MFQKIKTVITVFQMLFKVIYIISIIGVILQFFLGGLLKDSEHDEKTSE